VLAKVPQLIWSGAAATEINDFTETGFDVESVLAERNADD
jgi:hypothetical protein